ncbi:MAG: hypothetical protein JO091_02390 [Acidobacteriaceae bacterium]|nr:hypothetical protein [Acidobacteriaceae bacterium]
MLTFAERDRSRDAVDLAPELIALFRFWKTPAAIPFLVRYIKEDPDDVPDEVMEALVEIGPPALEPLLALYGELPEPARGEIAFVLASLRVEDERIGQLLTDRRQYDASDAELLLSIHNDPGTPEAEAFDICASYPERTDLPVDLLDEDERTELLNHPVAAVRAAAAYSFFHRELSAEARNKLLHLAQQDDSPAVRARAWEALIDATDEPEVVQAMLAALRRPDLTLEERGGLLVGLAAEADRNEVRKAITELYETPGGRAKALEAMWRSVHPDFSGYFAKHLDDTDVEVRRGAIWGIGYYGLKTELDRLRTLLEHEELRSDALFAYALALPAEMSRGRMKGLLARVEKDAHGLSEMEEELVKTALDERLMLAGKEPFFARQED